MKNLFIRDTSAEIVSRIGNLSTNSHPAWGKMNVTQMLAHCQVPLEVALKDKELKRSFIGFLFGKIAKKKMIRDKPFAKNLPTDKSFIIANPRDFEEEKSKLINLVNRFYAGGANGLTTKAHPFFGKMTPEEWSLLSYKHLDHHLRQFGV